MAWHRENDRRDRHGLGPNGLDVVGHIHGLVALGGLRLGFQHFENRFARFGRDLGIARAQAATAGQFLIQAQRIGLAVVIQRLQLPVGLQKRLHACGDFRIVARDGLELRQRLGKALPKCVCGLLADFGVGIAELLDGRVIRRLVRIAGLGHAVVQEVVGQVLGDLAGLLQYPAQSQLIQGFFGSQLGGFGVVRDRFRQVLGVLCRDPLLRLITPHFDGIVRCETRQLPVEGIPCHGRRRVLAAAGAGRPEA